MSIEHVLLSKKSFWMPRIHTRFKVFYLNSVLFCKNLTLYYAIFTLAIRGGVNLGSQIPKIAIFNFFLIDCRMAFELFLGTPDRKIKPPW